jgi:hypothetical protein
LPLTAHCCSHLGHGLNPGISQARAFSPAHIVHALLSPDRCVFFAPFNWLSGDGMRING